MMDPAHSASGRHMPKGIVPVLVIGFIWLFVCLWFGIQASSKLNGEVVALKDECEKARMRSKILEYQLTSMMSAEKLENVAMTRYGFKKVKDDQVIVVKKEVPLMNRFFDSIRSVFSREK
jgi:hypothetical protein